MKKNMGIADIAIRLFLAAVISILYITNAISGTFGVIALVIAGLFIITSFIGVCPLYSILGLTTRKKKTI